MRKQFYKYVEQKFGCEQKQLLKLYSNIITTNTKLTQSRIFLIRCRQYGIIPNFITNKDKNYTQLFGEARKNKYSDRIADTFSRTLENFHIKILNLLIRQKCNDIKRCRWELKEIKEKIKNNLPTQIHREFLSHQTKANLKQMKEIKERNQRKFAKLKEETMKKYNLTQNEKCWINLTSIDIPIDVQVFLALGKKFALPIEKLDYPLFDIIADCEECLRTITDEQRRDITRSKFSNILFNDIQQQKSNGVNKLISRMYADTKNFLKRNNNIVILNADKGNITVAMEKEVYLNKMRDMITDRTTYWPLRKDPTSSLQTKNNRLIGNLKGKNLIDDKEKAILTTYKSVPPRIYGLPKVHKMNIPIRPIVASIDAPAYRMSKFLTNILNMSLISKYNIKDSFEFKDKITEITMKEDETMVSFDAISLFTNIPIRLFIAVLREKWPDIEKHTKIPKEEFIELIKFCVIDNNYFIYEGKTYKQSFGMPMGNPLAPVAADFIMEYILDSVINKTNYTPKFLTKYVDDIFAIIKKDKVDNFLNGLNSFHQKLKFTVERENNNTLPYLEVEVIRENNRMITKWYQKPITSGRSLNYLSRHPRHMKINLARNFINRVIKLSDQRFFEHNIEKIKKILTQNCYPKNLVTGLIGEERKKQERIGNNISNLMRGEQKIYRSMVYVPGMSEKFNRIVNKENDKLKLAFKTKKVIGDLYTKQKEKLPMDQSSNIVYMIPCAGNNTTECQGRYIGQTSNMLKTRLSSHRSNLRNKNINSTALAKHCLTEQHEPDFDNATILDKEANHSKRLILESLHIYSTPHNVNYRQDIQGLQTQYCAILETYRDRRNRQCIRDLPDPTVNTNE